MIMSRRQRDLLRNSLEMSITISQLIVNLLFCVDSAGAGWLWCWQRIFYRGWLVCSLHVLLSFVMCSSNRVASIGKQSINSVPPQTFNLPPHAAFSDGQCGTSGSQTLIATTKAASQITTLLQSHRCSHFYPVRRAIKINDLSPIAGAALYKILAMLYKPAPISVRSSSK
jgi:hypothetical protein